MFSSDFLYFFSGRLPGTLYMIGMSLICIIKYYIESKWGDRYARIEWNQLIVIAGMMGLWVTNHKKVVHIFIGLCGQHQHKAQIDRDAIYNAH